MTSKTDWLGNNKLKDGKMTNLAYMHCIYCFLITKNFINRQWCAVSNYKNTQIDF